MSWDDLETILPLLGIYVAPAIVVGIFIGIIIISNWPAVKLFFIDIFWKAPHTFVRAGRRFNVKCEIEGSINSFTKEFNSEMVHKMLPECQVEWITENNQESILKEGKAIVRVSYKRDNHDLNIYNTAYAFVRTSLLPHTKIFLNELTAKALDLLMTRNLIKRRERVVLSIFNSKFKVEKDECKQIYYQLDEIEQQGLFKRLLLQELYFFGENIGNKTPDKKYEEEADRFIDWLYNLATREEGEKSELCYVSQSIKAAIMLVASEKTFSKYGLKPYITRAQKHASNGYLIFYILARGKMRSKIAVEIAKRLVETRCFSFLTKKHIIKRIYGNKIQLITCIPLKIETETMVQKAWDELYTKHSKQEQIDVLVETVNNEDIVVNVFGLKAVIPKENLSNLTFAYTNKYFAPDMELSVRILGIDREKGMITLSNKGTNTDPESFVNSTKDAIKMELVGKIERVVAKDGIEMGVVIVFSNLDAKGFIPRSKATFSRFVSIDEKYNIGDSIRVRPINFDINHASLICEVTDLVNPWDDIEKYKKQDVTNGIVREIREKYITCEIEDGVEGRLLVSEISWNTDIKAADLINQYHIGDKIEVKVVAIDSRRKILILSKKRLVESPLEIFFKNNQIVDAKVISLDSAAAILTLGDERFIGFLPKSEMMWLFCDDITKVIKERDQFKVCLLEINYRHNNIVVSAKKVRVNKYDSYKKESITGNTVQAKVAGYYGGCVRVNIYYQNEYCVAGYVHESEISSILYINDENMLRILPNGNVCSFTIKRFNDALQIVELSRKSYLKKKISEVTAGKIYKVNIVDIYNRKTFVCSDEFEGIFTIGKERERIENNIDIRIVGKNKGEGWVQVERHIRR